MSQRSALLQTAWHRSPPHGGLQGLSISQRLRIERSRTYPEHRQYLLKDNERRDALALVCSDRTNCKHQGSRSPRYSSAPIIANGQLPPHQPRPAIQRTCNQGYARDRKFTTAPTVLLPLPKASLKSCLPSPATRGGLPSRSSLGILPAATSRGRLGGLQIQSVSANLGRIPATAPRSRLGGLQAQTVPVAPQVPEVGQESANYKRLREEAEAWMQKVNHLPAQLERWTENFSSIRAEAAPGRLRADATDAWWKRLKRNMEEELRRRELRTEQLWNLRRLDTIRPIELQYDRIVDGVNRFRAQYHEYLWQRHWREKILPLAEALTRTAEDGHEIEMSAEDIVRRRAEMNRQRRERYLRAANALAATSLIRELKRDEGAHDRLKTVVISHSTTTEALCRKISEVIDEASKPSLFVSNALRKAEMYAKLRQLQYDITECDNFVQAEAHRLRHLHLADHLSRLSEDHGYPEMFAFQRWHARFYIVGHAMQGSARMTADFVAHCIENSFVNFNMPARSQERAENLSVMLYLRSHEIQQLIRRGFRSGLTSNAAQPASISRRLQLQNVGPFENYLADVKSLLDAILDITISARYNDNNRKDTSALQALKYLQVTIRTNYLHMIEAINYFTWTDWIGNDFSNRQPLGTSKNNTSDVADGQKLGSNDTKLSLIGFERFKQSSPSDWSYDQYRGPQGKPLHVHLSIRRGDHYDVARLFLSSKVLGFDIFDVGYERRGVQMILLANEERIGLFHLAGSRRNVLIDPHSVLRSILQDGNIIKVGVNMKKHAAVLADKYWVDLERCHELGPWRASEWTETDLLPTLVTQRLGGNLPVAVFRGSHECQGFFFPSHIRYLGSRAYAAFQLYRMQMTGEENTAQAPEILNTPYAGGITTTRPPDVKSRRGAFLTKGTSAFGSLGHVTIDRQWYESSTDYLHSRYLCLDRLAGELASEQIKQWHQPQRLRMRDGLKRKTNLKAYHLYTTFGEDVEVIDRILMVEDSDRRILSAVQEFRAPFTEIQRLNLRARTLGRLKNSPFFQAESSLKQMFINDIAGSDGSYLRSNAAKRKQETGIDPLIIYAAWHHGQMEVQEIRSVPEFALKGDSQSVFEEISWVINAGEDVPYDVERYLSLCKEFDPEQVNKVRSRIAARLSENVLDENKDRPKMRIGQTTKAGLKRNSWKGRNKAQDKQLTNRLHEREKILKCIPRDKELGPFYPSSPPMVQPGGASHLTPTKMTDQELDTGRSRN